jgi:rSAM/selenodomain-associated transferase 1
VSAASPSARPTPSARVLVLAKEPVPGRVKTRLTPEFSPDEAAALARAALEDTLDAVATAVQQLAHGALIVESVLVLDGSADDLRLPLGFRVRPQGAGELDRRLAHAFAGADDPYRDCPTVLIGMDTPQVSPEVLTEAVASLLMPSGPDACLGLASDGGWWLLGLRRPDPTLLLGLPMSTSTTGAATAARLRAADLTVSDLPVLCDIDTADDADLVAAQIPGSRFARLHTRLTRLVS